MSAAKYAIEQGAGGWWVCQLGVDFIDPAVLKDACSDNIWNWDGVIYKGFTKEDSERYMQAYFQDDIIVGRDD